MDDLDIEDLEQKYYLVWMQRNILLNYLTHILDGLSAKEISSLTGLPVEHCEKIIDDCYRLNQGKSI